MSQPLRFALAGVRHFHLLDLVAAIRQHPATELVAAAEDDPAAAAEARKKGVELTHESVAAMLEDGDRFDVLAVGDYYTRRGSWIIAGLRAGKHVISDKPLCTDLDELAQIEALAGAAAGGLVVGCQLGNRFNGALRQMRELVADNAIGAVHTVTFLAHHPLRFGSRHSWYFEPGKHGGTVNDIGIHAFDILPWMLDLKPRRLVAARCWNERLRQHPQFQVCAQLMLELDGGTGVMGDLSYLGPDQQGYDVPHYWRFTLHGETGLLEAGTKSEYVELWPGEGTGSERFPALPGTATGYLDELIAEIRGDRPSVLSSADVLRAQRWALEAQGAADRGATFVDFS